MKSTILILLAALPLIAQEKQPDAEASRKVEQTHVAEDDPFANDGPTGNKPPGEWRKSAIILSTQVRMEWIEADTKETINLLDSGKPSADAAILRSQIMALEKTTVMDALLTQLDVGEKSTAESIVEMIYPTEYEPAGLGSPPEELERPDKEQELLAYYAKLMRKTGIAPTAFETRNTGLTVEMALEQVKADSNQFDLSLTPEKVIFCGMKNLAHNGLVAEMPIFATVRTTASLRLKSGQWRLVKIQSAVDQKTGKLNSNRNLLLFVRLDLLAQ